MMKVGQRAILMKVLSIIAAIPACFLLYFGTGMLLVVPGYPGEGYFAKGRIVYGFVPVALSVALLLLSAWLWSYATRTNFEKCVGWVFGGSIGLIVLFWVVLIVIANLQGRIP